MRNRRRDAEDLKYIHDSIRNFRSVHQMLRMSVSSSNAFCNTKVRLSRATKLNCYLLGNLITIRHKRTTFGTALCSVYITKSKQKYTSPHDPTKVVEREKRLEVKYR